MDDKIKRFVPIDEALTNAAGFRDAAKAVLLPLPPTHKGNNSRKISSPKCVPDNPRGDWDLNPELKDEAIMQTAPCPAAVLVPIIAKDELTVLLTLRPEHMSTHAGQISFPGGKLEPQDHGNPITAALRETDEEIGLPASHIEPIGLLDNYRTGTGFQITPVVALIEPGFKLELDAHEVADAFEVPLRFLMNERNHQRNRVEWQGRQRAFHVITYQKRYIWGATAGIIKNLHERLTAR